MRELILNKPSIFVSTFIPFGINNITSFIRHIGALRRYIAKTEFGNRGAVKDPLKGSFVMPKASVLINVMETNPPDFVVLEIQDPDTNEEIFSLKLDQDGLVNVGTEIQENVDLTTAKIIAGKMSYRIPKLVYPLLVDQQKDLLAALYECESKEELLTNPFAITYYPMVVSKEFEGDTSFKDSEEFLNKYPFIIRTITDWILFNITVERSHVFIGSAGLVCIGEPSKYLRYILETAVYLKNMDNCSLRLFEVIWTISSKIKDLKTELANASYNKLKKIENEIIDLSSQITLVKVLDKTLESSVKNKELNWSQSNAKKRFLNSSNDVGRFITSIDMEFSKELQKAVDRDLTLSVVSADLDSLRELTSQRTDLILTKNSENLNLLVLLFTLVSLIGIAEIVFFQKQQWIALAIAIGPFLFAVILYLVNYFRNFLGVRRRKKPK